jgi:hypothetical protein
MRKTQVAWDSKQKEALAEAQKIYIASDMKTLSFGEFASGFILQKCNIRHTPVGCERKWSLLQKPTQNPSAKPDKPELPLFGQKSNNSIDLKLDKIIEKLEILIKLWQ